MTGQNSVTMSTYTTPNYVTTVILSIRFPHPLLPPCNWRKQEQASSGKLSTLRNAIVQKRIKKTICYLWEISTVSAQYINMDLIHWSNCRHAYLAHRFAHAKWCAAISMLGCNENQSTQFEYRVRQNFNKIHTWQKLKPSLVKLDLLILHGSTGAEWLERTSSGMGSGWTRQRIGVFLVDWHSLMWCNS